MQRLEFATITLIFTICFLSVHFAKDLTLTLSYEERELVLRPQNS